MTPTVTEMLDTADLLTARPGASGRRRGGADMGKSVIEWTDFTFNPWWGCQRVSAGCEHCYAETMAKRWGHSIWGPAKTTSRRFFSDRHWLEPLKWNREAEQAGVRRRVFCASMADVFEDNHALWNERNRLWDLISETESLDWLLLTKRPENLALMLPYSWRHHGPWPNVWLGTSVEDQRAADERIPLLLQPPAAVRFLSVEPLLSAIDLSPWLSRGMACDGMCDEDAPGTCQRPEHRLRRLDWIIAGGESGPNFRPCDPEWVRSLRDQCQAAGAAYFFKQWGGRTHAAGGRLLDGREWSEFPEPVREAAHATR